jgi:hypothetical protein
MNNSPENNQAHLSEEKTQELVRSLLHKEGTWVDWGKACQQLQKLGYTAQQIFEQTGFQASQQNLVIVSAQVYDSIAQAGVSQEVLTYCQGPKSDVLYELRILNQEQRAAAAQLAYEKKLDVDGAHEVARAVKEISRFSQLPEAFTSDPGDAVAYFCWKRARQKKDLQERSRLIAQGLKFARSQTAREAIETLLSDFTVVPSKTAPLLPIYRLESDSELPRIIPVAGSYPISRQEIEIVARIDVQEPFRTIQVVSYGTFVPVPGWQSVLKAVDPVGFFWPSDRLPKPLPGKVEEVLVILDRAVQEWDANSYFLVEKGDKLELQWFEAEPNLSILGQLVLILRPKKILDENNLTEPWQMDD